MIWFAIAWRNLWRQRRRSLITASAMAVSVGLCMSVICLNDGTFEKMFNVMVEQQLGHIQVHNPEWPGKRGMYDTIADLDQNVAALEATDGVQAVSIRLHGFGLVGGDQQSAGTQLVGIDPDRERTVSPVFEHMQTGTYLTNQPDEIILGHALASDLEVGVGDEVVALTQASDGSLGNELFRVVGTYKSGNMAMDRTGAYVHLGALQTLLYLEDQAHELTILADDTDALQPLAARLATANPTLLVQTWREASPQTAEMLSMQDAGAMIILGIVFLVASFGVVNTMLISVFERTREFGVLRALGVTPLQLVSMVVIESVILAIIAGTGGLILGGGLDAYLVFQGIDLSGSIEGGFDFNGVIMDPVLTGVVRWQPIVLTVSVLLVVSAVAAVWPAMRAASIQPIEAIRSE